MNRLDDNERPEWFGPCGELIETVVGPVLREVASSLRDSKTAAYAYISLGGTAPSAILCYEPYGWVHEEPTSEGDERAERERLRFSEHRVSFICEAEHGDMIVASFKGSRERSGQDSAHRKNISRVWVRGVVRKAMEREFD